MNQIADYMFLKRKIVGWKIDLKKLYKCNTEKQRNGKC